IKDRGDSSFCFFFQAEDGIRDRNVTGVQTCALPILIPIWRARWGSPPRASTTTSPASRHSTTRSSSAGSDRSSRRWRSRGRTVRSEERRVGKESRDRRAPEHCNKKRDNSQQNDNTT